MGVKVGTVLSVVMASCRIETILRSADALTEPIRVRGAPPAARGLILARWLIEKNVPTLVLCPTDESAEELANDIEALSASVLGEPLNTVLLSSWDQSPYSSVAPSLRTRLARIAAIAEIARPRPRTIYLASIPAAAQTTLPKAVFERFSLSLQRNESVLSREDMIRRLIECGYSRVDPVEDPGTFAVRGDIVDVFPPGAPAPLRIELFGDVIEQIREFDPSTQRARPVGDRPIQEIFIPPAREVLINQETSTTLRERLKQWADDAGIPRSVRDPILEAIQYGTYPEHADTWTPFAYEKAETLWDYLDSGKPWAVAWNDEFSCLQEWDRFSEEQRQRANDGKGTSVLAPAFESLFRWSPEIEKLVRDRTRLYLDQITLADTETLPDEATPAEQKADADTISARLDTWVKTNEDLGTGSRHSLGELEPKFALWRRQGFKILITTSTRSQAERIQYLLQEHGLPCRIDGSPEPKQVTLCVAPLSRGFRWPAEGIAILTDAEVLGTRKAKRSRKPRGESSAKEWSGLQALSDLAVGDHVVHVDHGIGRYQGLVRLSLSGAPSDFLQLEYANKDRLYLPVYRLNVIQKYAGTGESASLDRLGSQHFAKTKEKVREAVKKLAIDLVQLYAERAVRPGIRLGPPDSVFREFEAQFLFDETPDQLKAIENTIEDMESGKAMDRIVCGDVGYGKTEVAMRAAFLAVNSGKQVAVLVPTTILAHQHEQNFKARLCDHAVRIEALSRFKSPKEQKLLLADLTEGKIDIAIGTHRLLSKDVKFKDLGLIIVDEEHRFGVEHKERLKTLRVNTHVLTLTATPIPRTLHMALSGLRDISLINTPPVDRLPIRTYVSKHDEEIIKRAVEFELGRGGQVFYLHNRVQTIEETAARIRELAPHAKIAVAHGQMSEGQLEKTMMQFYSKEANVLVCTAIIESGLDLPSANTILVDRADILGLAQLYQIRGRVGRGQQRAYAYLFIPEDRAITEDAKKRIEVIQRFVELGSGFSIASHDLEIRGGGDLLGPQQSGHIAAVGFDLYTELLEEAIRELKGKPMEPAESRREPEIKVPFGAYLADEYVPDVHQRLSIYRRFSAATDENEIDRLEGELHDRFGPLPTEAHNLLWLIRIKQLLKRMGIDSLTAGPQKIALVSGADSQLNPARAIALVSAHPDRYQLLPDSKLVVACPTETMRDLFFAVESLVKDLL